MVFFQKSQESKTPCLIRQGVFDFISGNKLPHQPDLQKMEDVIYKHNAPWCKYASCEFFLAHPTHPVLDKIRAVLQEMKGKQDKKWQPAPASKKHHCSRPD
ncbi:MAG: hypothetical protein R6W69_12935 [Anaerolineales bacterium]